MSRSIQTLIAAGFIGMLAVGAACRNAADGGGSEATHREVTVYVSADRPFSEPILQEYQRRFGVHLNAVYDTEETKSTGLANRLLAEQGRAQADVFWSNEPVRTLVLKSRGVLAPYRSPASQGIADAFIDREGYWTGFSARLRVIVYNTDEVQPNEAPRSIFDLAEPKWKGRIAIADPRFGSTSFHVAAIYAALGEERADDYFRRLKANGVRVVDGNSVVRDMVSRGEVAIGLTDTDDVNVAIEAGQPVAMVLPDREGIGVPVMPNMLSLIAGAPHAEEAKRLIDFLLSPEVERRLAESDAVQIPLHREVPGPKNIPSIESFKPMTLDYGRAAARVEDVTARLASILGL
jgi:iron(III) transport system substrate-binding protein